MSILDSKRNTSSINVKNGVHQMYSNKIPTKRKKSKKKKGLLANEKSKFVSLESSVKLSVDKNTI